MIKKIAITAILLGLFLAGSLIAEGEQVEERIVYDIYTHTYGCQHFSVWVTDDYTGQQVPGCYWENDHHVTTPSLPTYHTYTAHAACSCDEDSESLQPFVDCHLYLYGGVVDPTIPEDD
ncbi:MAG: hypothetical protein ISS28_00995 [Candidatus Cloacimonetes bacterium]|nr:hypothetical protein [Candidatus Cloacimonadota bacterium]MBL7085665.1 hypothetical protein [Candidatus Cloacimonadota bacterium]